MRASSRGSALICCAASTYRQQGQIARIVLQMIQRIRNHHTHSACPLIVASNTLKTLYLFFLMTAFSGCGSLTEFRPGTDAPVIRGQDGIPDNSGTAESWAIAPDVAGTQSPEPVIYLPLTLRDAIEAALMDSSVVRVLDGRVNVAAILPTDVLIAEQRIAAEQGRFQPRLTANLDRSIIDQPPNAFFGPGIAADTSREMSSVFARVTQPLTTGGSLSVGFEPPLAYLYLPKGVDPGQFNPIYSTTYVARVIQPVLRGAGPGVALAPIQIAQTQANQSRWALEDVLNSQIRSITEGYWRLYAAQLELEAVKTILPLAEESVRVEELRWKADRSILADVARARFQRDGFRRSQSVMQGNLRKRVLQLRQLLGGQPDVLPLFLPSERPSENPPPEDVPTLVQVAISNRPSLNLIREQLSEKNIVLRVAENQVLPSLDLHGEYYMNGLADRLGDSFRQAGSSNYTDWTLGLGMDVPIGNKTARSRRQIAELDVARVHIRLKALEQNVAFEITELISDLHAQWQRLEIAKLQARETQEWLRVSRIRYTQPQASNSSSRQDWLLLALTDLQSAMRSYVEAVSDVGEALAEYNTLLADLNQAQGISVYQWRQQATQETDGGTLGGHAGILNQDYRANPGSVLQMVHASQKAAEPRLSSGLLPPADGLMLGHSFLNEKQPPPLELPATASTFDLPRDSDPAQKRVETPVRP